MDHLQKLTVQIKHYLWVLLFLENLVLIGSWWALDNYLDLTPLDTIGVLASVGLVLTLLVVGSANTYVMTPIAALWQAVLHAAPGNQAVGAPNTDKLRVGRDLVATLSAQIYQLANQAETKPAKPDTASQQAEALLLSLPLPLVVLDKDKTILYVNEPGSDYLGQKRSDLIGSNLYAVCNMSFSSDQSLDDWLDSVRNTKALANGTWTRVKFHTGEHNRQFDMAAHFSSDNPVGAETTLIMFDHTEAYGQDDRGLSFVAMSVHELRTPLTLLRGYIEVFEDELGETLSPELKNFMHKMSASAEQLTAFVSNILNVARVENDQLVLSLEEADWNDVLKSTIEQLVLRARVRGIEIEYTVADNLPKVGIDRVSIYEVLNNFVDNAIKYSGESKKIAVDTHLTTDGLIETTVQDWGVGIPRSIMPNLFTRFYRNYHNRSQIGGTGLGLYLSKAIVAAHGGNVWARSQEGEGSTFGFTLLPYEQLSQQQKSGTTGITRGAHGWIKNHSLYRD